MFIPKVIYRHQESLNKIKVRKSMENYNNIVTRISIDNDLRTESALKEWGKKRKNCNNTIIYFQPLDRDGCTFKTAYGVYWYVRDITKPIIAMSKEDLEEAKKRGTDGQKSFMLITSFDDNKEVPKINDLEIENLRLKNELAYEEKQKQISDPRFKPQNIEKYQEKTKAEIQTKINELEKIYNYIAKSSSDSVSD